MEKIVIYGAGNMGRAVFELLNDRCNIIGFMDGNRSLRGQMVMGVPIYHPDDVISLPEILSATVLVAMTVRPFSFMKKMLKELGFFKILSAGDYVSECYDGITILNTWKAEELPTEFAFSDERSIQDYQRACQWFCSRTDEDWNLEGKKYFPYFLHKQMEPCKTMLDIGVLDGGFIEDFLKNGVNRSAYGLLLTPQSVPVCQLKEKFQNMPVHFFETEAGSQNGCSNVQRLGMMRPFTQRKTYQIQTKTIDTIMKERPFDYLRCYSMSEALPILNGGKNSIQKYRPIIAVNISHYKSDFLCAPTYLSEICEDYSFYFRMHSYQGNDCIIYAVPQWSKTSESYVHSVK